MSNGNAPVAAETFLGENGVLQQGWLDNLPEDTFEKDDTGKLKQADLAEQKDLASIAKVYMNAQKLLGTAIQPLPDDATPEQKRAHFTKFGCPEKVEGYEVVKPNLPEGMVYDDDLISACQQFAFDNGIPKGPFEGLFKIVSEGQIKKFNEIAGAVNKAEAVNKVEADKKIETASNELKGKWGADYDKNLEMANRFYDLPGDDATNKAFTDLMTEKGLDSHPAVVAFFQEAYKLVKEDELPEGGTGGTGTAVAGQLAYDKSPNMQK